MAKLNATEVNRLKAIIEGGDGKTLYDRLFWDRPKNLNLSQAEKAVLSWHLVENENLSDTDRTLLERVINPNIYWRKRK